MTSLKKSAPSVDALAISQDPKTSAQAEPAGPLSRERAVTHLIIGPCQIALIARSKAIIGQGACSLNKRRFRPDSRLARRHGGSPSIGRTKGLFRETPRVRAAGERGSGPAQRSAASQGPRESPAPGPPSKIAEDLIERRERWGLYCWWRRCQEFCASRCDALGKLVLKARHDRALDRSVPSRLTSWFRTWPQTWSHFHDSVVRVVFAKQI